mgnify:CR=1 FL=1
MSKKNCLVLGSTGQDGSLLSQSLLRQGFTVFGTCRKDQKICANHKKLNIDKNIKLCQINLSNTSKIRQLIEEIKPVEIYNMAAQSSVAKSFSIPQETFESIVLITLQILEACKEINYQGRIFFAGSSEMYGANKSKITINSRKNPSNPYGIAKLCSYNLVKMYREIHKLRCVTGIFFNHESQLREKNFVTHKIVEAAIKCQKHPKLKITLGNLDIFRDWGWAEEYIEAATIINRSDKDKDYIICTGEKMQLKQFVEIAFQEKGLDWKDHIILDKSLIRPSDMHISYGDPEDLKKDLNWHASIKGKILIKKLIQEREFINH